MFLCYRHVTSQPSFLIRAWVCSLFFVRVGGPEGGWIHRSGLLDPWVRLGRPWKCWLVWISGPCRVDLRVGLNEYVDVSFGPVGRVWSTRGSVGLGGSAGWKGRINLLVVSSRPTSRVKFYHGSSRFGSRISWILAWRGSFCYCLFETLYATVQHVTECCIEISIRSHSYLLICIRCNSCSISEGYQSIRDCCMLRSGICNQWVRTFARTSRMWEQRTSGSRSVPYETRISYA